MTSTSGPQKHFDLACGLAKRARAVGNHATLLFAITLIGIVATGTLLVMEAPKTVVYLVATLVAVFFLGFLVKGLHALLLHAEAGHADSASLRYQLHDAVTHIQEGTQPILPRLPATGSDEKA